MRELTSASSKTLTALLTPAADAKHLELVRYDDTGYGAHTYAPVRELWLKEAEALALSAAAHLATERES